jgi:hypothetical protein
MTFGVALLSSQQFFSGASISGPLSKTQSGECLAITIRTQRESRLDFSVLMKWQETDFDIVAAVPAPHTPRRTNQFPIAQDAKSSESQTSGWERLSLSRRSRI